MGAAGRIVYLELVAPRIDTPESRAKWLFWLRRDFSWALEEGWSVDYWGIRDRANRVTSWEGLRIRGPRVPFSRVPWVFLVTWAWLTHFVLALVGRRPGILLARSPYLGLGAALARVLRRRLPLVVRIVEQKASTARNVYGAPWLARAMEAVERFVLRRADLVIPIAGFTREVAARAGVAEERIVELHNPPRWGSNDVPDVERTVPAKAVCAARLGRPKAVDVLLRAFAAVAEAVPEVTLEVAGDGGERAALERLAADLGVADRVRFHGWLPAEAMPGLFASAQVSVLPSRVEEGHPMALREAGLAGCALIGTDLGGIRDIVRHERSGLLVPPEDHEALAEALERLLVHPEEARRMGEEARKDAVAYFRERDEALGEVRDRLQALALA